MTWQPHSADHEARALWHLELLGCFEPGDAVAPWEPLPPDPYPDDWDVDEWDEDAGHACTHCGGEAFTQVDDPFWDECG